MEQGSTNVNIVSRTVQPQRQTIRNRVAFLEKRTPVYASVLGVLGILTLWEGLARIQVIPPLFLPSPSAILAAGCRW